MLTTLGLHWAAENIAHDCQIIRFRLRMLLVSELESLAFSMRLL